MGGLEGRVDPAAPWDFACLIQRWQLEIEWLPIGVKDQVIELSEYCPKLLSRVERRAWKTGTLHKELESICGHVQLQTSTISVLRREVFSR